MSITKVDSIESLLEASNAVLAQACAQRRPAYLVVPSHEWGEVRKLQLLDVAPMGVQVLTFPQLIDQLWELFGNGDALVQELERKVLLRPLVTQAGLFQVDPSPRLLDQLSAFVQEAVLPGLAPSSALSDSESRVMELVSLYEQSLRNKELVELAQAEHDLLQKGVCAGMEFVFEAPDLHSAHTRQFLSGLELCANVSVLEQALVIDAGAELGQGELEDVRHRLFTGSGGVVAQGAMRVGEALGVHGEAEVITQLALDMHRQNGIPFANMALCVANPSRAYPQLPSTLARAGVPFRMQFSLPADQTGLGAAFRALEILDDAPTEEDAFKAAVDLVSNPCSGVPPKDARAVQMRWRERAHSNHEARMQDLRQGFDQGNVHAEITKDRFEPVVRLIDASRHERIALLFENAKEAHVGINVLLDDKHAAEAIGAYLEACDRLGGTPYRDDMAKLPVPLVRAFGDPEESLVVLSPRKLAPRKMQGVLMAGLDANAYPMAALPEPFDGLMLKLGINRVDSLAQDQRLMLLNAIEACETCFAMERATHDAQGDELCQSALFEELLAVYRSPQENEAGLAVQAIPQTLQPWLCRMSEADILFAVAQEPGAVDVVVRGALKQPQLDSQLLYDSKGKAFVFSPTALEDYYRCPYRWFTSRRVGYNGMDAAFDPAAQGNLVHAVMERFYKDLACAGYARVTPENLTEALEIASAAFDAQVEHERGRERRGLYLKTQSDLLQCEELRDDVLAFVERDATFLPGFVPTYFELELGSFDELQLEYAGVPVRGKVDRIDVDQDGNAVIIDYKLSTMSTGYGFAANADLPQRIQTDIYASMVQRYFDAKGIAVRVLGSVYRSYSKNILRGVYDRTLDWGIQEEVKAKLDALPRADSQETYDQYLQRVEAVIAACVDRLKMGNIEPNPISEDACEYCKGALFCPRRES